MQTKTIMFLRRAKEELKLKNSIFTKGCLKRLLFNEKEIIIMSKILVIAEKPAAGKDIARVLGVTESKNGYMENDKYIVTWAVGHLVGLKDPDEVDEKYKKWNVEDLPLPYDNGLKVLASAKGQFKIVKSLIQRDDISYLINAGDAGREGLLIQTWIYRMCGNKHPVKILWASSLTDEAIKTAMGRLHDENEKEFIDLLREAETRAVADQVYGYNYTRALTCLYSSSGTVLSYGRCQTPLLNLIYKRDLEIENFKSVPYWMLNAEFDNSFVASEIDDKGESRKYMSKEAAEAAFQSCGKQGQVKVCKKEQKTQKAPALFNLAEIQGTMGKKYGLKPDETLEIAQKLYETHKIMSYPRTDSRYLSTDLYGEIADHVKSCSFGKFKKYIDQIDFSAFPMDKTYFNNNKVSDHHALIPTINSSIEETYNKLSDMEKNFFDEIVASLIAIFYPPYRYESTEILIEVSDRTFQAKGTVVKELGYKEIQTILKTGEKEKNKDDEQPLPDLSEGQQLDLTKLELKEGKTKPPARYNPGNIVKLMNKYKIGTSATSANIIQTLEKRKFIVLDEKKKYKTTELGRNFISRVPEILKSKDLTIDFENKLAKVNTGEITKNRFIQDIIEQIKVNIEKFKQDAPEKKIGEGEGIGVCPVCGKLMRESSKSWYCSGYASDPKCSFYIRKKIREKIIPITEAKKLLKDGKTDLIKGFKTDQGRKFNARLIVKEDHSIGFEFPD